MDIKTKQLEQNLIQHFKWINQSPEQCTNKWFKKWNQTHWNQSIELPTPKETKGLFLYQSSNTPSDRQILKQLNKNVQATTDIHNLSFLTFYTVQNITYIEWKKNTQSYQSYIRQFRSFLRNWYTNRQSTNIHQWAFPENVNGNYQYLWFYNLFQWPVPFLRVIHEEFQYMKLHEDINPSSQYFIWIISWYDSIYTQSMQPIRDMLLSGFQFWFPFQTPELSSLTSVTEKIFFELCDTMVKIIIDKNEDWNIIFATGISTNSNFNQIIVPVQRIFESRIWTPWNWVQFWYSLHLKWKLLAEEDNMEEIVTEGQDCGKIDWKKWEKETSILIPKFCCSSWETLNTYQTSRLTDLNNSTCSN